MKQIFTFLFVIAVISSSDAATYRTYIAHTISGTTYSVFVDSDTVTDGTGAETAGGQVCYTPSGGGGQQFSGFQYGTLDGSVSGANWRIDITVPAGATNILLELFTRNQTGSNYGFSGCNISMNNLLPVELTVFKANIKDNQTIITWQTTSELNNSHFDIQRSNNSKTWNTIDKVAGAGTTDEVQDYTFTDKNPIKGINYYRLMQVDYDGAYDYSPIVSVDMGKEEQVSVYPNPVVDEVVFEFDNQQKEGTILSIYNLNGQLVQTNTLQLDASKVELNMTDLEEGVYFMRVIQDNRQVMTRFVKQ